MTLKKWISSHSTGHSVIRGILLLSLSRLLYYLQTNLFSLFYLLKLIVDNDLMRKIKIKRIIEEKIENDKQISSCDF
jgi:hypothetical protein